MLNAVEKEIACRLAQGETLELIGLALGCHTNTVNNHIARMKKRFKDEDGQPMKTQVQLVVHLTEKGLLDE
ncbi:MAG: helix-turn-helix transcriptional regulator [Limisphaerales bacterium]